MRRLVGGRSTSRAQGLVVDCKLRGFVAGKERYPENSPRLDGSYSANRLVAVRKQHWEAARCRCCQESRGREEEVDKNRLFSCRVQTDSLYVERRSSPGTGCALHAIRKPTLRVCHYTENYSQPRPLFKDQRQLCGAPRVRLENRERRSPLSDPSLVAGQQLDARLCMFACITRSMQASKAEGLFR